MQVLGVKEPPKPEVDPQDLSADAYIEKARQVREGLGNNIKASTTARSRHDAAAEAVRPVLLFSK